ncbi:hypothetical protein NDU88_001291 [Pleurodeles waltl]|uniref:Uncharacterized protein n=1 Tax=Pleurodeles waltl TaxID=8319 RepID=A0AAV7KSJ6_PLEWA|nr:hypothetical protein NDU88_001291 [Pleurodeles waltl]
MSKEDRIQEERVRTSLQERRRRRRRNTKLPATLQEKRGILRCILGPVNGNQAGWCFEKSIQLEEPNLSLGELEVVLSGVVPGCMR